MHNLGVSDHQEPFRLQIRMSINLLLCVCVVFFFFFNTARKIRTDRDPGAMKQMGASKSRKRRGSWRQRAISAKTLWAMTLLVIGPSDCTAAVAALHYCRKAPQLVSESHGGVVSTNQGLTLLFRLTLGPHMECTRPPGARLVGHCELTRRTDLLSFIHERESLLCF